MAKIYNFELKKGMRIIKDLYLTGTSILLIPSGTVLNEKKIKKLRKLDIFELFIDDLTIDKTTIAAEAIYDDMKNELINVLNHVSKRNVVNIEPIKDCVEDFVANALNDDEILVNLLYLKRIDNYTVNHSMGVFIYSLLMGRLLGLDNKKLVYLGIGALLHDVGKSNIPLEILNKPGKLEKWEFEEVKKHPIYGFKILERNTGIHPDILRMVLEHHESFDGSGYPAGKKAEEILFESKLIALADVYDAVTTERVYRKAMQPYEGVEILMALGSVKRLDPNLVQVFLENITIYPLGSMVELSTGLIGKVVHIPRSLPIRPTIQLNSTGEIISLLEKTTIFIKKVIQQPSINFEESAKWGR